MTIFVDFAFNTLFSAGCDY